MNRKPTDIEAFSHALHNPRGLGYDARYLENKINEIIEAVQWLEKKHSSLFIQNGAEKKSIWELPFGSKEALERINKKPMVEGVDYEFEKPKSITEQDLLKEIGERKIQMNEIKNPMIRMPYKIQLSVLEELHAKYFGATPDKD